jgi:2-C-methyl-D-erythritol 4-phosphate cytidylyltransferase
MSDSIAVIFAGGVGRRMGSGSKPKQFLEIHGKPIIIHTLEHFQRHPRIGGIFIASLEEYIPHMRELAGDFRITKIKDIVPGGATSQDSIYNGLTAARRKYADDAIVLIHDGVRPMISEQLIDRNIESVERRGNAVTCCRSDVTVVMSADGDTIGEVPIRDHAWNAVAPQSFRLGDIIAAHDAERAVNPTYENVVDACTMLRRQGKPVHIVEDTAANIKITKPEDYYIMRAYLQYNESKDAIGI